MVKITVKDVEKEFHNYEGEDLRFYVNERGVEIVQYTDHNGETKRRTIGQFFAHSVMWVKERPARAAANTQPDGPLTGTGGTPGKPVQGISQPRPDVVDRYTQAELDQRDPNDAPDFAMLNADTPLNDVMRPDMNAGESLERLKAAGLVNVASMVLEVAVDGKGDSYMLVDEQGTSLVNAYIPCRRTNGLLPDMCGDTACDWHYGVMAEEAVENRFKRDGVAVMDTEARRTWLRELPQREAIAMKRVANRTESVITDEDNGDQYRLTDKPVPEKPKRAPRQKKPAEDNWTTHEPLPEGAVLTVAQDLLDDDADPVDALRAAEARHQRRMACETCKGRGTVRDEESDDPLDTKQCPTC